MTYAKTNRLIGQGEEIRRKVLIFGTRPAGRSRYGSPNGGIAPSEQIDVVTALDQGTRLFPMQRKIPVVIIHAMFRNDASDRSLPVRRAGGALLLSRALAPRGSILRSWCCRHQMVHPRLMPCGPPVRAMIDT